MKKVIMMCLLLGVILSVMPTYAQEAPSYTPADCDFESAFALDLLQNIECGVLTVPEEYETPNANTIALDVLIIHSTSDTPAPDPLFILQGGPGGSTINDYSQVFALGYGDEVLATRDVVLFDQRGTLNTSPNLMCQEVIDASLDVLDEAVTMDDLDALNRSTTTACYNRLIANGINLSAYDSVENAADVSALATALGYETYNLYGVSYGTLLAQHVLRDHPDGLRSVILDAVLPINVNYIEQTPFNVQDSLNLLFTSCATDATCNAAFPELETVFYQLLADLNTTPLTFTITDPMTGSQIEAVLTGDMFVNFITQMLYSSQVLPRLPQLIYDTRAGNTDFLSIIVPQVVLNSLRTISQGMYNSVICAEYTDFTIDKSAYEGVVDPRLLPILNVEVVGESCDIWQVEPLADGLTDAVASDIPVLLLSGEFDPVTPAKWAQAVATSLSNGHAYQFSGESHGIFLIGDSCPNQMVMTFLDNPSQAPDDACIQTMTGIDFVTGDEVVALVPFENADLGVQGVIPDGWNELIPGAYIRPGVGDAAVIIQVFPAGLSGEMVVGMLAGQLGAAGTPEISGTYATANLTWDLYTLEAQGLAIDAAIATANGNNYILLMQAPPNERDIFVEIIFLPMLDALQPLGE